MLLLLTIFVLKLTQNPQSTKYIPNLGSEISHDNIDISGRSVQIHWERMDNDRRNMGKLHRKFDTIG